MDLICGINPVLEALRAGVRSFDRLLIAKGTRNRRVSEAISHASRLGIPLRFEGREALDRLAQGVNHQGVIAIVSAVPMLDVDALLAATRDPGLLVVLDGVEDPRNLGAILRTVEAGGADGVIVPERRSASLSEGASRSSAGAVDYVRVARAGNLVQALDAVKARGLWVIGFDASGTKRWDEVDYKGPVALVFGGEGRGMRRLVRERCDHLVSLPLFGHVTSLNVSVAVGIALYEAIRQRGAVPCHVKPIPPVGRAERSVVGPGPEDTENDPGALSPPYAALAAVAHEDELGDPASDTSVSLIDWDEDVAWMTPPAEKSGPGGTQAHGAARGGSGPGVRDGLSRRRRRRRGQFQAPAAQSSSQPAAGEPGGGPIPAPGEPGPGSGRRFGRRKRGRGRRR